MVHHHSGVDGRHSVVPDPHCRAGHDWLLFTDLLAEFDIHGRVVADSRVEVRGVLDDRPMEMLQFSAHFLNHDISRI